MLEPGENYKVSYDPGSIIMPSNNNYFSKKAYKMGMTYIFPISYKNALLSPIINNSGKTLNIDNDVTLIQQNLTKLIMKYCKDTDMNLYSWGRISIHSKFVHNTFQLYELIMKAKDGKEIRMNIGIFPIFDEHTKFVLRIEKTSLGNDVTYKKFLEALYKVIDPNGDPAFLYPNNNNNKGGRRTRRTCRKTRHRYSRRKARKTKSRRSRK